MTPEHELIRRLEAERDAYKQLAEQAAMELAAARYGSLALYRTVSVGGYVFKVSSDASGEWRASILPA